MVYKMGMQWNTSSCIGKIDRPSTYTEASYAESEAAKSALLWELETFQSVWDVIHSERRAGSQYFSTQNEIQLDFVSTFRNLCKRENLRLFQQSRIIC